MGLWVYPFRVRKRTRNPHCIFCTSNYKLWRFFSDLQFLGDLANDDDPSWATDTMGLMQGKKGIIGKGDNALDPDKHFDVIALMLGPPASCCVWRERVSRWLQIMRWILFVICYIGCFCTVFVSLPRIRYFEYFITSSSSEEEDVTMDFGMFSKYTLRYVYEQWQHIQLAQT